jgi:hypothetical protein
MVKVIMMNNVVLSVIMPNVIKLSVESSIVIC